MLDNVINIELGGGYSTQFRYCYESSKIHGLYRFIGKYSIKEEYFLFFKYLGNSTIALSVYDTQGMDHLRNNLGYLRLEDFANPPYDAELFVISSDSDDNMNGNVIICTILIFFNKNMIDNDSIIECAFENVVFEIYIELLFF